jgi:predicted RNA-binding Zn-ribbon protein involved in translation (DUF1610 family)
MGEGSGGLSYVIPKDKPRNHFQRRKVTVDDYKAMNLTDDELIKFLRYTHSYECPKCGNKRMYGPSKRKLFECSNCGYQQSPTAGTIMEKTRVSLNKWFLLFFIIIQEGKNLTVVRVRDELKVSYPTAKLLFEKVSGNDISLWTYSTWKIIHTIVKDWLAYKKVKTADNVDAIEVFRNKKDGNSIWYKERLKNPIL